MTSLGVAKASVTKAVTAADQLLQEHSQYLTSKLQFPQDNEEEVRMMVHVQESKLNTCIDRTESHLKTIEEKYSKLEELADDQDTIAEYFEKVEEIRGRLEAARMEFKAKLHLVLAQKDITYRAITARVNNGEPSDTHSASLERLMTTVVQQLRGGQKHQLPVIQLPQFSGDPWDFKKFWFGFEQLVHDNFDLTDYEKLTYLRSCLREDALRLVNTVPDDEYTYERTVSILKGKYDDKLAVAHQLHKKIRTLRTQDNSSSAARDLLERLQQLVPRLTDYGDAIDNRSFLTDLLRKFPDRVRTKTLEKIVDSSDDHPWSWKTISRLLERVIERNELLEAEREVFQSERPEATRTRLPPPRTHRRHADESSPLCFLCEKGPHPPEQCRSTPFMDRRSVMQNKGLCFRCGVSHDHRSCQQRCPNCNRPHHVALCRENRSETTDNNDRNNTQRPQEGSNNRRGSDRRVENNTRETNQRNQNSRWNTGQNNRNSGGNRTDQPWRNSRDAPRSNATPQNNSSKPNPTKKETVNVTTENVNLVTPQAPFTAPIQKARNSPSGAVILTGMVPIMKQNHAPVPARALFDSGASISFIDSALVKELNLPIVEQRLISLQTFGQKSVERMYAITQFAVLDLEGKVYEVQAVCVPGTFFSTTVIPALSPADQAIIAHHGVTVADPNPDRREESFRIILDCDLMWNFICRQSKESLELPSGLKLIPSVFGYLRTGRTKDATEVNNPGALHKTNKYRITGTSGTDPFPNQTLNEHIHRKDVDIEVPKEFEASRRIDGGNYNSFSQRSAFQDNWKIHRRSMIEFSPRPVSLSLDRLRNSPCTPAFNLHLDPNSANSFNGDPPRMGALRLTCLSIAAMLTFFCLTCSLLPMCAAQTFPCASGGPTLTTAERQGVTYTRSVRNFAARSKRCARNGSCIIDFCGKDLPHPTIEEFGRYNDDSGKTYCTQSNGFIAGGCFFPNAGRLLWREMLAPDSWTERSNRDLTLVEGATQTFLLPLVPGRQKTVNGHRITVTNIERAVYPILNSHFISDGNYTAVLENSEEIHLWCSDREAAQKGRCQAEPNCKCQPAETTMHCECNPTRLKTVFEDPKRVLPVHHTNIVLREQVVAELEASGSVLVEWNITAQKSVIHEEKNPCTMELSQLEGCYACREGSRTHATCSSSRPFTAALTCGDQVYAVDCAPGGKQSDLHYFSNYASVDVHCETHCDPTVLALQETLRYHSPVRGLIQAASWTANDREITLPDVSHLISSVAEYIGIRVIILMIVGTIIGGLYLYLRGQTWFLTPRLLAQQQKSHQL